MSAATVERLENLVELLDTVPGWRRWVANHVGVPILERVDWLREARAGRATFGRVLVVSRENEARLVRDAFKLGRGDFAIPPAAPRRHLELVSEAQQ